MKKRLLSFLFIILMLVSTSSCKKEAPKTYSGSVMVYTTFDEITINDIKNDFEDTYGGVVLDYFYGNIDSISEKVNMSYMLEIPEADILLINDENALKEFKSKSFLTPYTSKENKKVLDEYKAKDGFSIITIDGDNRKYYAAVVTNGLNTENANLLIDYLLSKKTQKMLADKGLKTVRKDVK